MNRRGKKLKLPTTPYTQTQFLGKIADVINQDVRWLTLAGGFAAIGTFLPASFAAGLDPATTPVSSTAVLDWNTGANKSLAIPSYEIPAFLTALNLFNRSF